MAITTRLEIRQGQQLVMTPQLQQAIRLLQLSNMELVQYVETELERNPLLERRRARTRSVRCERTGLWRQRRPGRRARRRSRFEPRPRRHQCRRYLRYRLQATSIPTPRRPTWAAISRHNPRAGRRSVRATTTLVATKIPISRLTRPRR